MPLRVRFGLVAAAACLGMALTDCARPDAASAAASHVFHYTGAEQLWVVPPHVTFVTVTASGAQGGDGIGATGGNGGSVTAEVTVTPGETLAIFVGGRGRRASPSGDAAAGGFNGGAPGGCCFQGSSPPPPSAGGGGGASDVRRAGRSLEERIVVAGGGGGGAGNQTTPPGAGAGGAGGGATGAAGADSCCTIGSGNGGEGGGPGGGGRGGSSGLNAGGPDGAAGMAGAGGAGATGFSGGGGGGGGGYFGGGGGGGGGIAHGGSGGGGGGGGSSFVVPGARTLTSTQGDHAGDGEVVITSTAASTTTLRSAANPLRAGRRVRFTATVAGDHPTGTVAFRDRGSAISGCAVRPLVGGHATCTTRLRGVRRHRVTARYSGDAANSGSTSPALIQIVERPGAFAPPQIVRLRSGARARVRVACPRITRRACAGVLVLRSRRHGGTLTAAPGRFKARPGRCTTVMVVLTSDAQATVRREGRLRVLAAVTTRDRPGRTWRRRAVITLSS